MSRFLCYFWTVAFLAIGQLYSAPLKNVRVTVVQPNGDTLRILASGDEFHNWLHDADQFTIIQDPTTGFYTYAVKSKDGLAPSQFIVGKADPKALGLEKALNVSTRAYQLKRDAFIRSVPTPRAKAFTAATLNNLVIFIRFAGEPEFTTDRGYYDLEFNASWEGASSVYMYFREASYGKLSITSSYYPAPNVGNIVSYEDAHPRGYYQPYDATTNPIGCTTANRWDRESTLLANALASIAPEVPAGLRLDAMIDGVVDNIVFVIKGGPSTYHGLLWPHSGSLNASNVWINGKQVRGYSLQIESSVTVGILCHEMAHAFGAPDLYHFSLDGFTPVGHWDLMAEVGSTPQEIGAYIKSDCMQLLGSIPEITRSGTYSLYPLATSTRCAYRIRSPYTDDQFYIVEYRRKVGTFDGTLSGQGLLVYRIYPVMGGNEHGPPDGIYIYRPGGTPTTNGIVGYAPLSAEDGRTSIGPTTNPIPFLINGSDGGLRISEVSSLGSQMTFRVALPGPSAPSLLASYPLDEATAFDSSGNHHTGTVGGAVPVADRFNSARKALGFNGTDSKVTTGMYFYAPVNNLSVSLWLKTDLIATSKYECLIGDAANHKGFRIYRTDPYGDSLHFEIRGGDSSSAPSVGFRLLPQDQGQWVHMVAVSFCGLLKIYKNGLLQDSTICSLGTSQTFWANSIGMGFESSTNSGFWTGALDDVRLYTCALTEDEVQNLYHEGDWPRAPILSTPLDMATGVSTSPTLSWRAPDGALSYRVQLSTRASLDTLAYDSSGITSDAQEVTWLSGAIRYWWRVLANFAGSGDTALSLVRSFTTLTGPYSGARITIPGTIEAECYDAGGEGLTYHDMDTENLGVVNGSRCRTAEGVDTEPCKDPEGGGFDVAWTHPGEWLRYAITVLESGLYGVEIRVATPWPGRLHLEADGTNITGPIGYGDTGGWQNWASVFDTVMLIAGDHDLCLVFDDTAFGSYAGNVNRLRFRRLAPLKGAVDLTVSDLEGTSAALSFGFASGASDDLDAAFGESQLPSVPGAGVFDARFLLPTAPALGSLVDLRKETSTATLWRLTFQPGVAGYPITFRWTKPDVFIGGLRLEDESGGTIVDVDMELDTSYVLTKAAIASLAIRYTTVARPDLISPENAAIDVAVAPTLTWCSGRQVPSYRIQLASDSLLQNLVVDTTIAAARMLATMPLAHDAIYWWRVCAVGADTLSDWTPPWHFKTIVQHPAQVALVSPLDLATVGTDSVRFSWRPSEPQVARYWFEVAADSLFRFSIVDSSLTDTSTAVRGLSNGQTCWWKVAAGNVAGWGPFSLVASFKVLLTGANDAQDVPKAFNLAQNYPNPFNPTTTIEFDVPRSSRVRIVAYDLLGREVAQLSNGIKYPGRYRVIFNAEGLASGIYVVRMQADAFCGSKRIVLLR